MVEDCDTQMTIYHPIIAIIGILFVVLNLAALLIWVERRLLALWQDRYGPNRTGPFGLLQPFADAIKLFAKEDCLLWHRGAGKMPSENGGGGTGYSGASWDCGGGAVEGRAFSSAARAGAQQFQSTRIAASVNVLPAPALAFKAILRRVSELSKKFPRGKVRRRNAPSAKPSAYTTTLWYITS